MRRFVYIYQMKPGATVLLAIVLALFVKQALVSYWFSKAYGGTDLRTRIVGSRLMEAGKDPYFYKWQRSDPQTLAIPPDLNATRPVNGVSVTPLVLKLQAPFSRLGYASIRQAWWLMQQLLLLFCAGVFIFCHRGNRLAVLRVLLASALFTLLPFWQIHFERGQVYLLYAAWISALYLLMKKESAGWMLVTGCWLAFGIFLRLPLVVFGLPLLLKTPWKKMIQPVVGFVLTALACYYFTNTGHIYDSYFKAMHVYADEGYNGVKFAFKLMYYPPEVEGIARLSDFRKFGVIRYFSSLHYYLGFIGIRLHTVGAYAIIFCCFALLFSLLLRKKINDFSNGQWLLFGFILYECAEVCLPNRAPYNPVQWLPALLAAVCYLFEIQPVISNKIGR